MVSGGVLRAGVVVGLAAALAIGLTACGGGSSKKTAPPPDPVTMALQAPGVRTIVVPQQSNALTIVVPPCSAAELKQESSEAPPGSNQVVVPKASLDQTIAIQPCIEGAKQAKGASTVLLSPGGAGSPQSTGQQSGGQPQNQLLLPKNANIKQIIVPPCIVQSSSSSSSSSGGQSGGTNLALPATGDKTTVTAPPCKVAMTSSSSGG